MNAKWLWFAGLLCGCWQADLERLQFACQHAGDCRPGCTCVQELCAKQTMEKPENKRCDGQDNDGDGQTDEMRLTSVDHCGSCNFACPRTAEEGCQAGACSLVATQCLQGACHGQSAVGPTDC